MERKIYDLWIDISNIPQVHIMWSLIREFNSYSIGITGFNNKELFGLMKLYGLKGKLFGSSGYSPLSKSLSFAVRSFQLLFKAPRAGALLSFENAMPIPAGVVKGMRIILMLDNDLKFVGDRPLFQRIESKLKNMAHYVMV
ncbi:MAG: DUF354 domain-containing protein, partial [Candidatus Odinarchaeia archaeon]